MASHSAGTAAFVPVVYLVTDAQSAFGTALVRSLLDRQPESAVLALCTSQPDGPANTRLASLGSLAAKVGKGRLAIVVVPSSSSIEAANANADADELRVAVGEVDFVSRFGVDMLVLGAAAGLDVCSSCDTAPNLDIAKLESDLRQLVHGSARAVQQLLPLVRQGKQKRVVGLSSVAGSCGLLSRGRPAVCSASGGTATAALIHYLKRLSFDLQPEGINLAIFSPGFVRDDPASTPTPTAASTPDEAAASFVRTFVHSPARATGSHLDQHGQIVPW